MIIQILKNIFVVAGFSAWLLSCGQKPAAPSGTEEKAAPGQTPVQVDSLSEEAMTDSIELNAVSAFLMKSYVKANANGYLQMVNTYIGKYVEGGQLLFTLKTKEAQSIGNIVNRLDTNFRFSGVNKLIAGSNGYITTLNHQSGDYVQDGEQLAVISDASSFVFLLDLPYEWRPYVMSRKSVQLLLPDGERLEGMISATMPTVDAASQTQPVIIRVNASHPIPENLVAKVHVVKTMLAHARSLPKPAVLSNETQDEFWVMKMIDSSHAVKVPVKKGLESKDRVEILSPVFSRSDKFLVSGNYGLPDTAFVKIVQ